MPEDDTALDLPVADDPESIAQSLIPYNRDDDRARYLGLRASGFKIREALKLVNKHKSTLTFWRKDAQFLDLETRLWEFGKQLSTEYAWLDFRRNLVLVGILDYRTLQKAIEDPELLSPQEAQYLNKLRSFYTPQHMQALEALIVGNNGNGSQGVNFTDFVLEMTRTQETVKIASRNRSGEEPILPKSTVNIIDHEG